MRIGKNSLKRKITNFTTNFTHLLNQSKPRVEGHPSFFLENVNAELKKK